MSIAVLCADTKSIYHQIQGLDVYDKHRDTRTFIGSCPVIAHPPCRGYSRLLHKQAKPAPGEKDLALFCVERLLNNGGVLEHPKYSLFVSQFLNDTRFRIQEIHQSWFGYPIRKATWLLMPAHYKIPEIPFQLQHTQPSNNYRIWVNMTSRQRSETTKEFAEWLIELINVNC
jgi:hypothetical protein